MVAAVLAGRVFTHVLPLVHSSLQSLQQFCSLRSLRLAPSCPLAAAGPTEELQGPGAQIRKLECRA